MIINNFSRRVRIHKTSIDPLKEFGNGVESAMLDKFLEDVHVTSLEGLGSSYRLKGYFILKPNNHPPLKINFDGVAFGGNYGGHNVSLNISSEDKDSITRNVGGTDQQQIEDLISEIQRRLLNNEMIVDYDAIKPENRDVTDSLGI